MYNKNAACDFCDARYPDFIFEFKDDDSSFDEDFLNWYDAEQPANNFKEIYGYRSPVIYLLREVEPDYSIEGDIGRWTQSISNIYDIKGRYFMAYYERGLTEMQENLYDYEEIVEVNKRFEVKIVPVWEEVKHE